MILNGFQKIIFQNRNVALETPPPFMAKAILNFHFDYLKPSLNVPVSLQNVSLTALQCSEYAEIKTSLTDRLTHTLTRSLIELPWTAENVICFCDIV